MSQGGIETFPPRPRFTLPVARARRGFYCHPPARKSLPMPWGGRKLRAPTPPFTPITHREKDDGYSGGEGPSTTAIKEAVMTHDGHGRALHALGEMEQDAIAKARAAGERPRAKVARRREAQPAELSIPINGPYRPPSPGEQGAMAAMLEGLHELESRRWPLTAPLIGGGR